MNTATEQAQTVVEPESPKKPVAAPTRRAGLNKWVKRIGVWGFLFFLIKGLVWLAVGAGVLAAVD